MANNYDKILELANANNMGLSNTIKRDFGIPLDYTSVQKDYLEAVKYAATNTLAYIGQPISVGDKLYIVTADAQGKYPAEVGDGETQYDVYLAEVGSATEGDGSTIDLKDGVLSLHGIDGKLTGTYVPSLVNGVLTWNAPDNTTVDGLTASVDALELRADKLEAAVGKEAEGDSEATGLIKAIDDLEASMPTKLSDLENDIDAASTDYVDQHLPKGYDIEGQDTYYPSSVKLNVDGGEFKFTPDNLSVGTYGATSSFNIKVANEAPATLTLSGSSEAYPLRVTAGGSTKDVAFHGDALSNFKNNMGYQTAKNVSDAISNKADKADTLAGYGITDAYTKGEVDSAISSMTHLSTKIVDAAPSVDTAEAGVIYLVQDTDAEAGTYIEYILVEDGETKSVEKIGSTKTDLSDYVNTSALTTALAPYAKTNDVVTNEEFTAFEATNTQAISDARTEAVADVAKVGYALEESVASRLAGKVDTSTLNSYYTKDEADDLLGTKADAETVNAELAKKVETAQLTHTTEGVGEGVTKVGTQLNIVVDAYRKAEVYTKSETDNQIDAKIASVTGGESAADVKLALESYRDAVNAEVWGAKAAEWTTRVTGEDGKVTVTYTPQYGTTSRVDTLEAKVGSEKSGETAATGLFAKVETAQAAADAAAVAVSDLQNGQVKTNKQSIDSLAKIVSGENSEDKNSHAYRIGVLEATDAAHAGEFNALKGKVDTAVDNTIPALTTRVSDNETAIATINTTLNGAEGSEGLIAKVNAKADAANVYTKTEIDGKILTTGTVEHTAEGKSEGITISGTAIKVVVDSYTKSEVDTAISTAIGNIDNTAITNNAADIAVLVGTDKGEDGRANKSIRAIASEEVAKIVDGAPEALDTLAEIAAWITDDNTGSAAVVEDIAKHTAILAGFGGENQPATVVAAIETAKNEAIAAIPALEVATAEKLGGVKSATGDNKVSVATDGVMSVATVNVNTLTQTTGDVLILNGGSAYIV